VNGESEMIWKDVIVAKWKYSGTSISWRDWGIACKTWLKIGIVPIEIRLG